MKNQNENSEVLSKIISPPSLAQREFDLPELWPFFSLSQWRGLLDQSSKLKIRLPFLHQVRRSKSWAKLPEEVRALLNLALQKELMLFSVLNEETETAIESLHEVDVPVILFSDLELAL